MLTIVHGGQTGVDRGAHEAAIESGWPVAGFMPSDRRDERGLIPDDVAKFLVPHDKKGYAARTEANVRASNAALIIVSNVNDALATPGTAKTIELADQYRVRRRIVDPRADAARVIRWLLDDVDGLLGRQVQLPFGLDESPVPKTRMRLLVAGPRESKWNGARAETAGLLRRVALAIMEIGPGPKNRDLLPDRR
jgi:hypothetical protein